MSHIKLTVRNASTQELIIRDVYNTSNVDKDMTIRDFIKSKCHSYSCRNATVYSIKSAEGFSFMHELDSSIGFFLDAISDEESKHMIATIVDVQLEEEMQQGDGQDHNDIINSVSNSDSDEVDTLKSILPSQRTEELTERLKRLVGFMADEEQMNGKRVFAWNIMSIQQIKIIAAEVPTTTEELFQCSCGLPENIVKDYGERLLKNINTYIESNDLRSYIDDRPKKKLRLNHTAVNHHTNHQQH